MASRRVALTKVDEFQTGVCHLFTVGRIEIGVVRLSNGEFRALLNVCPHRAAPICRGTIGGTWVPSAPGELVYSHNGEVLMCPWHGREFDLRNGEELYHPRPTRLRQFVVEVEDGIVTVVI